jgi:hypothetical protein
VQCPPFDVGPTDEPPPSDVLRSERTRTDERADSPVTEAECTRCFGNGDVLTTLFHVCKTIPVPEWLCNRAAPASRRVKIAEMRTLLSEQYAPITSSIGFLRLDLDKAVAALVGWRVALGRDPRKEERPEGFPECLLALEPLVGGGDPRELFVATNGPWTAYFDCGLNGTDAMPPMSFLARAVGCDGLAVTSIPHISVGGAVRRYGAVQFELFGPHQTHFLNYVRTISVANDDGWRFDISGEPQPFEDQTAYTRTRVRDRFTSQMLADYCSALGIDVFNAAAYGPRAVLVRSLVKLPDEPLIMSLRDAQVRAGIVPGEADGLPG